MNLKTTLPLLALTLLSLAGASQANAATRIMQGNNLIGGTDVLVDGKLYSVDLGSATPPQPFPGPASPFATLLEAEHALQAIFTQLIGDGTGANKGALIATKGYLGSPEHKRFVIVQTYGDLVTAHSALGVSAVFETALLIDNVGSAPWPASATMSLFPSKLVQIPTAYTGGDFPIWTLTSSVPEPSSPVLVLCTGLLLLGLRATKQR